MESEFKVVEASSSDILFAIERIGSVSPNSFRVTDVKLNFKVYYKFLCEANSKYWFNVWATFANFRTYVGKAMCDNLYGESKIVSGYLNGKIEHHGIYGTGAIDWNRGWLKVGDIITISLNVYSPDNEQWRKSVKFTYKVTKLVSDYGWRRIYKAELVNVSGVESFVSITSFDVTPKTADVGEDIKACVEFKGIPNSDVTLTLYVNDNPVIDFKTTTDSNGYGYHCFVMKFDKSGEYNVKICVGGDSMAVCSSEITIQVLSGIRVENFKASKTSVNAGDTVTFEADITPFGTAGRVHISLLINGVEKASKEVWLGNGQTYHFSASVKFTDAGRYTAKVCAVFV